MMRIFLVLIALAVPAEGRDVMIVLNDQEQAALRRVLDSATKAEGIQIAPMTVYLMNKLNAAMEVVERKEDSKPATKDAPQ